jgi:Na+/H+ antiporter NhaD/arsenite permease-like protein
MNLGANLPLYTVIPFAALLLAIATFPLMLGHWWEHNKNKAIVAGLLSLPILIYVLTLNGGSHAIVEKLHEYLSFIILLGALYVISGGIYVRGSLPGTPLANTSLLALGAVIASIIGTTGASVLLIRPLLRANQSRERKVHVVVFFIFIVSNCGGLLTPLGDPPLFLGFLKGVPFTWTLFALWKQWIVVNAVLLIIFHFWDEAVLEREELRRRGSQLEEVLKHEPLAILGKQNFVFLAGVVGVIAASGVIKMPIGVPEVLMVGLATAAYFFTPSSNRENNKFTFGPIIEVAVLFFGIFITMAPALLILNSWGSGQRNLLGVPFKMDQPWQFFWASGVLSSFLDNAPTYLTFAATACGMNGIVIGDNPYLLELIKKGPAAERLLAAISCGAVFMGANTYIGNGPNFMVKAIAEENGVKMPSFFGYMAYSCVILIPLFVVVTFLFFR